MPTSETWKGVAGWPRYEISSIGRLRTVYRSATSQPKILRPGRSKAGYLTYSLWAGNKGCSFNAHRLVADAFLPAIAGKTHVNHKDFDRQNNAVENLEWVTPAENNQHSRNAGRLSASTNIKMRKSLTPECVMEIRKSARDGVPQAESAARYSVTQSTISRIVSGKRWSQVHAQ